MDALQEPAILYLIFRELGQLDLLRMQSVCRAWRTIMKSNKELLSIQWLHPGPAKLLDRLREEATLNPLLADAFPTFLRRQSMTANGYTSGYSNAGPWCDVVRALAYQISWDDPKDRQRQEKFLRPEASWRSMLPIWPPATEIQVHLYYGYESASSLARLKFSNDDEESLSNSRPSYLTFGLIHDLVENAFFHGRPHYVRSAQFDYAGIKSGPQSGKQYPPMAPISRLALVSNEFRHSTLPKPGRVSIGLDMSLASANERKQKHDQAFERELAEYERRRKSWKPRIELCGRGRRYRPRPPPIFTNEFHFEDGTSFAEVDWDEMHEYHMPAEPERPDISNTGRRRSRWYSAQDGLACGFFFLGFLVLIVICWPIQKLIALCKRLRTACRTW